MGRQQTIEHDNVICVGFVLWLKEESDLDLVFSLKILKVGILTSPQKEI